MKCLAIVVACMLATSLAGCESSTEKPEAGDNANAQALSTVAQEAADSPAPDATSGEGVQKKLVTTYVTTTTSLQVPVTNEEQAWVVSRIVPVELTRGEAASFGPWYAAWDPRTSEAHDDGSLSEWEDGYYITHNWSEIGQQIMGLVPGDAVTVNDRTMVVVSVFDYPKDAYDDEIRLLAGGRFVLQTCSDEDAYNRIVLAQ